MGVWCEGVCVGGGGGGGEWMDEWGGCLEGGELMGLYECGWDVTVWEFNPLTNFLFYFLNPSVFLQGISCFPDGLCGQALGTISQV